jgi:hypothetical protein
MNDQSNVTDKGPNSPMTSGQASPGGLLGLPTEILVVILYHLHVPDLLRVQPVSLTPVQLELLLYRTLDLPALGLSRAQLGSATVQDRAIQCLEARHGRRAVAPDPRSSGRRSDSAAHASGRY